MIEIRTDEDAAPAHPDGPHNPEQTRAIASGIYEAVRLLNYATMKSNGLRYPSDVYYVLGELRGVPVLLIQSLEQMRDWIGKETAGGHTRENPDYGPHGGDAEAAHAALTDAVARASTLAHQLADALNDAQASMRGMEGTRDDEEEEV